MFFSWKAQETRKDSRVFKKKCQKFYFNGLIMQSYHHRGKTNATSDNYVDT